MDAYEHFRLRKPPFDPMPDQGLFFDSPVHAEVLATLQYAVFARKGCCVVVGESGCGKTLLAKIVAQAASPTVPVFWVHGGGQSDNQTNVRVYPPRTFGVSDDSGAVLDSTLQAETHVTRFLPDPPLLIVDAADELPMHGWSDVIAWLSNEIRYPRPATVLLFGMPGLLETLASPRLVCLQRRVFRACRIETLPLADARDYIRARITSVGGDPDHVFHEQAIDRVCRVSRGNPALINHLCDNALLEAYSEERDCVESVDVGSATGVMLLKHYPAPRCSNGPGVVIQPPTSISAALRTTAPSPVVPEEYEFADQMTEALDKVADAMEEIKYSRPVGQFGVADDSDQDDDEDSIDLRLNCFKQRLTTALTGLRERHAVPTTLAE